MYCVNCPNRKSRGEGCESYSGEVKLFLPRAHSEDQFFIKEKDVYQQLSRGFKILGSEN
jgi:hypothetical protein